MPLSGSRELITNLLTDHHQLTPGKTIASSAERLRDRARRNLQRILIRLWRMRDWTFTYVDLADGSIQLTVGNNSEVELPLAWGNEGKDGGVWLLNDPKTPLRWIRSGQMAQLRNSKRDEGEPVNYTVVGGPAGAGSVVTTPGMVVCKLQAHPFVTADTPITLRYRATTPYVSDNDPPNDGLSRIPEDWRDSVVYEWMVWYEMKDKGDVAGMANQMEVVKDAVFDMCCNEHQGKPWEEHLPRFDGSADVMMEMFL